MVPGGAERGFDDATSSIKSFLWEISCHRASYLSNFGKSVSQSRRRAKITFLERSVPCIWSQSVRRGVLMMLQVRSKVFFGKSPATAPVTYQNLGNQCLRTVGGLKSCLFRSKVLAVSHEANCRGSVAIDFRLAQFRRRSVHVRKTQIYWRFPNVLPRIGDQNIYRSAAI